MTTSDFIHPEDAAALRQLESIPGFPTLVKKFYALGVEKFRYGLNMASNIRLSEKQLPEIYNVLPPICETLGIPEPEFYLKMDPSPNAWTFGDTKIFITVTSSLVQMMNHDELTAVVAHECGHIMCRHVLYHNMAQMLLNGADSFGLLGLFSAPMRYALYYWMRKSELSCDRVGAIITSPEVVTSTMLRLAGGPKDVTKNVDINEWVKQAEEYETIRNDGLWNKTLQTLAVMETDHPFSAVRVREILKWAETEQFKNVKRNLEEGPAQTCPNCRQPIEEDWMFCRHCGSKLR